MSVTASLGMIKQLLTAVSAGPTIKQVSQVKTTASLQHNSVTMKYFRLRFSRESISVFHH